MQDNIIEENIIEENIIEENIIEDNIIEENIIEDNIIEDNIIEDNIIEENIIEENIIEELHNMDSDIKKTNDESVSNNTDDNKNNEDSLLNTTDVDIKKIDLSNIQELLHECNDIDRSEQMTRTIRNLLDSIKLSSDKEYKKIVVKIMYEVLYSYIDILKIDKKLAGLVLTMKDKLHELIVDEKMIELIPIYNDIFKDKLYANITWGPPKEIINDIDFKELVITYNEKVANYIIRKKYSLEGHPFEEGEIVGAKNSEGDWWMSRIIKIFSYLQHNIFYIEFLGWGDECNEFITDICRIKKYNSKRHKYFRPVWKNKSLNIKEYK